MRLNPFETQIAAQIMVMMIGLVLSLPVFAAASVDSQHLFVGNADDEVLDAVADSAGNLYVAGWTSSSSIDGQTVTIQGGRDAFVAKVDASGNLLAIRVFGGTGSTVSSSSTDGNEQGTGIAIHQGNIFVTGALLGDLSNGIGLPAGIIDQVCRTTITDAFLLVLQPDLTPSYFTCFGDLSVVTRGQDIGHAIAVDGKGDVFVGGTSVTTAQKDGFVLKLKNPLTSGLFIGNGGLLYSKLVGGSSNDEVLGLTIDSVGQAYVTGWTISLDFPITIPSIVPVSVDAATDAFVARISADGSQISLSGLIGGDGDDQGNAIALDATTGDIYITGETTSADLLGGTPPGGRDAFVARILSDGTPSYLTYIGTTADDRGLGIVYDQDAAVVAGVAAASGLTSVLADFTYQGGDDAFVVRLTPAGSIAESAYLDKVLGGVTPGQANSIRLDSSGGFIVSGRTVNTSSVQNGFVIAMTHTTASSGGNTGNPGGGGDPIQVGGSTPSPAATGTSSGGGGSSLFWPVLLGPWLRRRRLRGANNPQF